VATRDQRDDDRPSDGAAGTGASTHMADAHVVVESARRGSFQFGRTK
jgi:hypothetical protein